MNLDYKQNTEYKISKPLNWYDSAIGNSYSENKYNSGGKNERNYC